MADGLVLARRESARGVHETAQRAGGPVSHGVVREYVGYEEWARQGFLRRETARPGVSLIMAFGDPMEVYEREVGSCARIMGAFVVGNQSRPSVTGVGGHQIGVQVELTPAGARSLFGDVEALNDAVVPLDETGWSRRHVTERFRRQLGVSPKAYARLLRFEHAASLLGVGNGHARAGNPHALSLAQTATAAGYYDQSHMARDFAALAGSTPGAYAAGTLGPEVRFVQDDGGTGPAESGP